MSRRQKPKPRHAQVQPRPRRRPVPDARPEHPGQVRLVAVVLAVTMACWMFLSWAGGFYGWDPRYAFLIDFLALAGFGWALIVTWRIWRARRAARESGTSN